MTQTWRLEEVPPPQAAPMDISAEALGLCIGLRAQKSRGQFRCASCMQMQRGGDWQAWVPDAVRRGDPEWAVTEACRRSAYNGHFSAWCISCAKGFKKQLPKVKAKLPIAHAEVHAETMTLPNRWWKFW